MTVLAACTAGASTLTRQPYLQRVGPDTATVAFRLDTACVASVYYGTHGTLDQGVQAPGSSHIQALVLTGLSPGTEYTYVVDACGARTAPASFWTAPVPGTRRAHFSAMGDFGRNNDDQRAVATAMLGRKPEFLLMLGDNAYDSGSEEEFQNNLFVPMAPLLSRVPFFAVPGNHEYLTDQAQPYLDNLYLPTSPSGGERYYSFDWGFIHFVAIDSNCALGLATADRCTLEAQKAWVERDLASSTAPWKVAFFHHPIWSSGFHGPQPLMRREFGPLFEKYGVDLVLSGHDHDYERIRPMIGSAVAAPEVPAPVYLVVGSGGATLRPMNTSNPPPPWSVLRDDQDHGYLDVMVEDGTLTARFLDPSGRLLDSFSLQKTLPPLPGGDPSPAPGEPGTSGGTKPPAGPGARLPLCSADPVMALLPTSLWALAGVLRRRRASR